MKARNYILILFIGSLLLQQQYLPAQEYLDLWRNSKTDNFYVIQKKIDEYFAGRDKGRGTGYKQFKRWEHFMAPRVYPSGKLVNPARLALDEELRYQGSGGNTQRRSAHTGNWQSLGIKYYSHSTGWLGGMGRVNCIVPHPTDPLTLFAGTPAGGLWKTVDAGENWIPLSDGLPVIGISGIAINPVYPDSIYILTGDGDGSGGGSNIVGNNSIGVLLSTNGGDTWQSTGLQWDVSSNVRGFKLLMHPTNSNILLAATNQGIYKTTNGGVNWALALSQEYAIFTDLAFKPGDPSTLYTAANGVVYTSTDDGENWTSVKVGFFGRAAIGISPAQSNYVYIIAGGHTGTSKVFSGVYRSEDGGKTFSKRCTSPNILGRDIKEPFDPGGQPEYDLAIAVSPTNAEEVHIGGINCWKSIDGGTTWQYTSYWNQMAPESGNAKYTHADIHALVFNGNTLYCGSDGGVYFSNNNANSWTDISAGLEITQFYSLGTLPDDLSIVYGGAQDVGLNKWTFPNTIMDNQLGADVPQCVMDYTDKNTVYAFFQGGSEIAVTQDGGVTWANYPSPSEARGGFFVPLNMNPVDHTTLYAGYNAVFKITDGGKIFTPISPEFALYDPCVALGMSAANPSYMYAAGEKYLKLCADINTSTPAWNDITGTLPVNDAQITDVEVSANDVTKAWVSFSGYANGIKMYQTTDAGTTWVNITGSLPNVPVNCIVYHNNDNDGVYIGTDIGVFYKDNTMTDWVPFRNGMPNVIVYDLKITNDRIRAGTFGRGIWESDLYGNCSEDFLLLSGDVTGYQFFTVGDGVLSTANIRGIGTKVQYKAANIISLATGFKVAPESVFKALIGECDNSTLNRPAGNNRQYRGIYEGPMQGALGIASIADSALLSSPVSRLKVYPNPFSQQSTIEFFLAKQTAVSISVWDLSGKKIKTVFESQQQAPGNYQVRLTGEGLSDGIYFVRLQTQDYQETKKIIITK